MPPMTLLKSLVPICAAAATLAAGLMTPAAQASARDASAVSAGARAASIRAEAGRARPAQAAPKKKAVRRPTVVLTFDDGTADHAKVAKMLSARGLKGTFYINSARFGLPGYLSLTDAKAIAKAGHEIGGHTLHHVHLPLQPEDVQQAEICDDRRTLLDLGFKVRSFAYPFGEYDESSRRIAMSCGYTTARGVYGLRRPVGCNTCPLTEKLPPAHPDFVRTTSLTGMARTARNFEGFVTRAKGRDGLLIFVFHHIRDHATDAYSTRPKELTAFLDWVAKQKKAGTIVVKPLGDAIGGPVRPFPADA
ncbi:hypothetical protein Mco01_26290 [Microbispora corallina]|uniref:NodB homology domain-containing protein n=1 Tax=Microbispora corallina TaxID=83302 RepID=A0ABQ4FXV4_9ACTN|nr:polysaccharide deacetylase family protein [Microbispora corallina]GIH39629.1 hypothetical protein Mco01_26290 [Microbispora corallina]